jgi:haloalkane dehalogenase
MRIDMTTWLVVTLPEPGGGSAADLELAASNPDCGEPADVVEAVKDYSRWLATSPVPKLYFHAIPGALDHSPNQVAFCRTLSNQEEIQVEGVHFLSEEAPEVVAPALAAFVRRLRGIA